ncbi:hypothetical protein BO78DRAFT_22422 [Aspergillus sclerotiicarbonarius CBS 121057]|uniref:Uncharacterized protein n=1 Tax=Aspergillus sclerotiicarbonarius (strain CBS 121057 / IBT 28362) TaxID=1448318 RepID=A0A319EK27_ASPSB|nr:hypothetical protein BO78DRAFT_22422 [Aspergillus sclerotiicarbonarius CBS 121057]
MGCFMRVSQTGTAVRLEASCQGPAGVTPNLRCIGPLTPQLSAGYINSACRQVLPSHRPFTISLETGDDGSTWSTDVTGENRMYPRLRPDQLMSIGQLPVMTCAAYFSHQQDIGMPGTATRASPADHRGFLGITGWNKSNAGGDYLVGSSVEQRCGLASLVFKLKLAVCDHYPDFWRYFTWAPSHVARWHTRMLEMTRRNKYEVHPSSISPSTRRCFKS